MNKINNIDKTKIKFVKFEYSFNNLICYYFKLLGKENFEDKMYKITKNILYKNMDIVNILKLLNKVESFSEIKDTSNHKKDLIELNKKIIIN